MRTFWLADQYNALMSHALGGVLIINDTPAAYTIVDTTRPVDHPRRFNGE